MNEYQKMQFAKGIEAAEIGLDIDAQFAAERLAAMEAHDGTDADYLAGFRSVINA